MKSISRKTISTLLLAFLLILPLTACGGDKPAKDNSNIALSEIDNSKAETVTDRFGKTIVVPEKTEKIISMAPSVTETLVHLGLADKLVAIDKYSTDIDGLPENLPTFDIMAPDTESIAALKPDIIFATAMSRADGNDPFKPVTDLGVLMTYIPSSESIEGIKEDIRFIGKITKTDAKAEAIISDMEKDIDFIVSSIGDNKCGKTVYFEVEGAPRTVSFGNGVFLNEIIELLGAKNIFSDQESWISFSEEIVIEKNPDVIFTNVDYTDDPKGDILNRNGWDAINAIKNNQVYQVARNASSRPNEYVTVALKEMARALYPGLFE